MSGFSFQHINAQVWESVVQKKGTCLMRGLFHQKPYLIIFFPPDHVMSDSCQMPDTGAAEVAAGRGRKVSWEPWTLRLKKVDMKREDFPTAGGWNKLRSTAELFFFFLDFDPPLFLFFSGALGSCGNVRRIREDRWWLQTGTDMGSCHVEAMYK